MQKSGQNKLAGWVACAATMLAAGTAPAGDPWMEVSATGQVVLTEAAAYDEPLVTVNRTDRSGLDVKVAVPGISLGVRDTKGGQFVEVRWPDASVAGEVGTPALPVLRRLFVAPPGATVTLATQAGQPVVVDESAAGQRLVVMPVQAPVCKLPGALEAAPFDYRRADYEIDAELPAQRATIEELGVVRGQRLFLLEVRPVAYNPAAEQLTLWPELSVTVRFEGGRDPSGHVQPLPGLRGVVLNPGLVPAASRGDGNYLIVAAAAYADAIEAFADAKQAQGFNVTTWVPSSASTTAIKTHIQSLWDTSEAPAYILLVGDSDTIPAWTGGGAGSPATDLPYACMDGPGDWYPDIAIGRFSVRSIAQLEAIVEKTLYYENGPLSDPDYVKRAVFMASEDNYTVSEGTHNWVIDTYMTPHEIVCDKLYCHTYSATTQQVRDAFNDGRFFGIFSGHGGTYSWADGPSFSQSDVNNLTNAEMYPFVMSFACITGTFTVNECFTETWSRAPMKGAVTIYGSSVNSYWTEDDVLEKRLFDAIYDTDDEVVAEVGPVWVETLMRYLEQMGSGSTTRRYFEMYNLMGDPSLAFPGAFGYALRVDLPYGMPDLLMPGAPAEVTVRIMDGDEVYVAGTGRMHCRYDGGAFVTTPLEPMGGHLYKAVLPPAECDAVPEYYFTAESDLGTIVQTPAGDSSHPYYTASVGMVATLLQENFQSDNGWTVDNDPDLTDGSWVRGMPLGGGDRGDPAADHDGSGKCFLTDVVDGDSDVDGGHTRLMSPIFDASLGEATIQFALWYTNHTGANPAEDVFEIFISNNGGVDWTLLETIGPASSAGWTEYAFVVSDFLAPTDQMRLLFDVSDLGGPSIVEAGVDDFRVAAFECSEAGTGDFDDDGDVDLKDFEAFQFCFDRPAIGDCAPGNLLRDRDIDAADFALFAVELTGPQ